MICSALTSSARLSFDTRKALEHGFIVIDLFTNYRILFQRHTKILLQVRLIAKNYFIWIKFGKIDESIKFNYFLKSSTHLSSKNVFMRMYTCALCALGNWENLSYAHTEMCARQIIPKIKFIFKADIFWTTHKLKA